MLAIFAPQSRHLILKLFQALADRLCIHEGMLLRSAPDFVNGARPDGPAHDAAPEYCKPPLG